MPPLTTRGAVPLPCTGTVKKKEHPVYGAFFKEVDPSVTATKLSFESDSD